MVLTDESLTTYIQVSHFRIRLVSTTLIQKLKSVYGHILKVGSILFGFSYRRFLRASRVNVAQNDLAAANVVQHWVVIDPRHCLQLLNCRTPSKITTNILIFVRIRSHRVNKPVRSLPANILKWSHLFPSRTQ